MLSTLKRIWVSARRDGKQEVDNATFVTLLYRGFLEREPEAAHLKAFVESIEESGDVTVVLKAIIESPEYIYKKRAKENQTGDDAVDPELLSAIARRETPAKAETVERLGRFREIVSDPLNLLIERHPLAGVMRNGHVVLHNGNVVSAGGPNAYYSGFSDILQINRGVHEPVEEYAFQEVMRVMPDSPTMLELGAYWGHYSMWLKKKRPSAKVILVEPEPININVGKVNFAKNGVEGEFINEFVDSGKFEVDKFIAERGITKLNILHSDIQGYEVAMLDNATTTFEKKIIDFVFISTHSQELHRGVTERLKAYGYRIDIDSDFAHDTTSSDGFVMASQPTIPPLFENFAPLGRERIAAASPRELLAAVSARTGR